MDRRIGVYKKFHEGYGEILVQMNVEDTNLILATGVISEKKVDRVLDAIQISLKDKKAQIYTDKLIP